MSSLAIPCPNGGYFNSEIKGFNFAQKEGGEFLCAHGGAPLEVKKGTMYKYVVASRPNLVLNLITWLTTSVGGYKPL